MTDTLPEVEEVKRLYNEIADNAFSTAPLHELAAAQGARVQGILTALPKAFDAFDQLQRDNAALREGLAEWALEKSATHHRLARENKHLRTEHIASSAAYRELAFRVDEFAQALLNPSNTGGR